MIVYIAIFIAIVVAAVWWLRAQFGDIARRVLKESSETFLDLAKQKLAAERQSELTELEKKKQAIDTSVEGLTARLEAYETLVKKFETDRAEKYGALTT